MIFARRILYVLTGSRRRLLCGLPRIMTAWEIGTVIALCHHVSKQ